METHLADTFESAFKITNISMLINGSHPSIKRDPRWMAHYALGMTLSWTLNFFVLYSVYHNLQIGDYTEACRHGTLGIVCFIISFKYAILLIYQSDTMDMIHAMERDYVRARSLSLEERRIVRHYAERGAGVARLWFAVAVGTSSLFPLKAICLMLYYAAAGRSQKVMIFEVVLPVYEEHKYDWGIYLYLIVSSTLYAYYAATVYMSFDPLVPIFMLHCCGQLELAKIKIMKLFPENGPYDPAATGDKLRHIVEHLQDIYSFLETARSNFTIVYEMVLKATTVLIPITLYQIIESLRMKTPSLEFISFGFGCLVHFYVPCYYSDLLMDKSLSVADAVYSCGWEAHGDARARRTLAFMIARAHRPLAMTTAFQTICLDSFTEMCRQSYAIYNLMSASVE